jgi:hypothetical protein
VATALKTADSDLEDRLRVVLDAFFTSPPVIAIAFTREPRQTIVAASRATTPIATPVRSLTQALLRWPEPERVGVFGSHGLGEAGVGRDLDLLLIDRDAWGSQQRRLTL